MSRLRITELAKTWGGITALDNVTFEVPEGTLTVLLGPSGCGKSTILRIIAGLEEADAGAIEIGGTDVTFVDPAHRGVSMVFQSYALFPHLNVRENILFGLNVRGVTPSERTRRLEEAAQMVGLAELLNRRPSQLSGGQRQRVALARAIVSRRPVCLMDEPLSNLDAKLRAQMRDDIRTLQQKLGLTMVYVTHDQIEAMAMADHVVLLQNGTIEQTGSPRDLYEQPATVFAARFIGSPPMNLLPCSALDELKDARFPSSSGQHSHGQLLGIRPEDIRPVNDGLSGRVVSFDYLGAETLVRLVWQDHLVYMRTTGTARIEPGSTLQFGWDPRSAHYFDDRGTRLMAKA